MDLQATQAVLCDHILRTAQELATGFTNPLSDCPRAAGITSIHYAAIDDVRHDNSAMYTLEQTYGGAAQQPIKQFRYKAVKTTRICAQRLQKKNRRRRLNTS